MGDRSPRQANGNDRSRNQRQGTGGEMNDSHRAQTGYGRLTSSSLWLPKSQGGFDFVIRAWYHFSVHGTMHFCKNLSSATTQKFRLTQYFFATTRIGKLENQKKNSFADLENQNQNRSVHRANIFATFEVKLLSVQTVPLNILNKVCAHSRTNFPLHSNKCCMLNLK